MGYVDKKVRRTAEIRLTTYGGIAVKDNLLVRPKQCVILSANGEKQEYRSPNQAYNRDDAIRRAREIGFNELVIVDEEKMLSAVMMIRMRL